MQMIPVGPVLLVREIVEDKSAGGLHLIRGTGDARDKDRACRCIVEAIGPGERRIMSNGTVVHLTCAQIMGAPVEVGAHVYCSRYLGIHRITRADGTQDKLQIVRAADVLGVEEP